MNDENQIKKYRKKPVIIKAVRWSGDLSDELNKDEIRKLCNGRGIVFNEEGVDINTLEGVRQLHKGEYLIKGVKGEIYPCKPDIFKLTYTEVK